MARSVARGAQGAPSAYLHRLHRDLLANILVSGGCEGDRVEAVRVLHGRSCLWLAPFQATHGARDHDRLLCSLHGWLGQDDVEPSLDCAGGTLFVDDPGGLPMFVQRLLLAYAERLEGRPVSELDGVGPARLAVGGPDDLLADVASGRLLASLHDTLDKLRVPLKGVRRAVSR